MGTILEIAFKKRLIAQTQAGEVVGSLPASFNYLAGCLRKGYTYKGQVQDSNNGRVATVSADFAAEAP